MEGEFDEGVEALGDGLEDVESEREAGLSEFDVEPPPEIDEEAPADGPVEPLDPEPEAAESAGEDRFS